MILHVLCKLLVDLNLVDSYWMLYYHLEIFLVLDEIDEGFTVIWRLVSIF
jgi:hypothetical protein